MQKSLVLLSSIILLTSCNQTTDAVEVNSNDDALSEALTACKAVVAAESGGSPNDVQNYGSGNEFYFAWPGGNIPGGRQHKVNGDNVEASASCIGILSGRTIQSVSANNKDVVVGIPRQF